MTSSTVPATPNPAHAAGAGLDLERLEPGQNIGRGQLAGGGSGGDNRSSSPRRVGQRSNLPQGCLCDRLLPGLLQISLQLVILGLPGGLLRGQILSMAGLEVAGNQHRPGGASDTRREQKSDQLFHSWRQGGEWGITKTLRFGASRNMQEAKLPPRLS
jgi:hypothetical protein